MRFDYVSHPKKFFVGIFVSETFDAADSTQRISLDQQQGDLFVEIRALVAIVEPKCSGCKVALTALALENAEFAVEVTNEVETFFNEERFGFAVLIWAFCGAVVHDGAKKQ